MLAWLTLCVLICARHLNPSASTASSMRVQFFFTLLRSSTADGTGASWRVIPRNCFRRLWRWDSRDEGEVVAMVVREGLGDCVIWKGNGGVVCEVG